MSVSVQPFAAPTDNGFTPESAIVFMSARSWLKSVAGCTPASRKTFVLYQTSDLLADLNHTP
jgi:hypothetical protein